MNSPILEQPCDSRTGEKDEAEAGQMASSLYRLGHGFVRLSVELRQSGDVPGEPD